MKKQINTFKFLILIITISSCFSSNEQKRKWTKSDMTNLIKEKTDLAIEETFEILEDSFIHTEGAFDLDYTYNLKIKYDQKTEKNLVEKITNSILFDTISTMNYADPIWKVINLETERGIWTNEVNGFQFLHCNNEINSREPFYLKIDTLVNKIYLTIIHL